MLVVGTADPFNWTDQPEDLRLLPPGAGSRRPKRRTQPPLKSPNKRADKATSLPNFNSFRNRHWRSRKRVVRTHMRPYPLLEKFFFKKKKLKVGNMST